MHSGIVVVRTLSLLVIGIMLVGSLFWLGGQMFDDSTSFQKPGSDTPTSSSSGPSESDVVPIWTEWPKPELALLVSGEQHGYFEPCGCTANQMGGMARRADLLSKMPELL